MIENVRNLIRRKALEFACREDGALLAFGLFLLICMLIGGGMAVDFMRYERERARLQYALDRSILAAAALSQPLEPKVVVADYLQKSGVDYYDLESDPQSGINFKTVDASAKVKTNSFFIKMAGVESMEAISGSEAEERVRKVEISLVLDVSGSMGWESDTPGKTKLQALQKAAIDFSRSVLSTDNENLVSMNIIPYNMQVNVGEDVIDELAIGRYGYTNCIDFTTSQFENMSMDTNKNNTTYQGTGRFDPFYTTIESPNTHLDDGSTRLWMCPETSWSEPLLLTQDFGEIETYINNLQAGGNTSIDIGVKWGNFFLDSSSSALVAGLPASYKADPIFSDRPALHSDDETLKILIVMTDGENTTQYELDEDYYEGPSDIWYDPDSSILTIFDDRRYYQGYSNYYRQVEVYDEQWQDWEDDDDDWINDRWRSEVYDAPTTDPTASTADIEDSKSNAVRMDWSTVWGWMGIKYHAYYHHYRMRGWASEYYDWRGKTRKTVGASTKNSRLKKACTAAKDEDVVVFTIGFEVNDDSAAVMLDCATSESTFYRVAGKKIETAFDEIVFSIQNLKLTK